MNIYFHIDELYRDSVTASAFKKTFREHGHKVFYGSRASAPFLKLFHDCFDVIVLPRPHFIPDMLGKKSLYWRQDFYMLSTESLGIISKDLQVMAKTLLERDYFEGNKDYINKIKGFLLWGNQQYSAVQKFAPSLTKKCFIVGHPRHDRNCIPNTSIHFRGRKNIGIVTRANSLNDYYGRSTLESFHVLFNDHFQYEFINQDGNSLKSQRRDAQPANAIITQAMDVETLLYASKELINEGYSVFLKPHPKESRSEWLRLFKACKLDIKIADPSLPFVHWIKDIDIVIGPPSTSFYDALMADKKVISIEKLQVMRKKFVGDLWEDNNNLMEFIPKPENLKQLLEECASPFIKNRKLINNILREEASFPACSNSMQKIASVITNSKSKSNSVSFYLFFLGYEIYAFIWKMKNRIRNMRITSSRFVVDAKTRAFIDSLTKDVTRG